MDKMHSLLKRQLKRYLGKMDSIPKEWESFIDAVNEAYRQIDTDREMLERSLDLSSQELLQANSEMRAVLQAFPDLLFRTNREGIVLHYQTSDSKDLHFLQRDVVGRQITSCSKSILYQDNAFSIRAIASLSLSSETVREILMYPSPYWPYAVPAATTTAALSNRMLVNSKDVMPRGTGTHR